MGICAGEMDYAYISVFLEEKNMFLNTVDSLTILEAEQRFQKCITMLKYIEAKINANTKGD